MPYPTVAEAEVYKSPTIQGEVRVAVELDYPVFDGAFSDDFPGAALDTDKWFQTLPSWGSITVAGGTVRLAVVGHAIAPPWIQTRHNIAFPLRTDTNWQFDARVRYPVVTGYGVFLRVCGHGSHTLDYIWGLSWNTADGGESDLMGTEFWSTAGAGDQWRRYRVSYNAGRQEYTAEIDVDDDGVYEITHTEAADGFYAEAIVVGNSTAIQGALGDWTEIEISSIGVTGTAEAVEMPDWAAPFTYDGTRFTYLPVVESGRLMIDKDNAVDVAEAVLANFTLDEDGGHQSGLYTDMRFWNRRMLVEGRAGDGNGLYAPWEVLFDGLCAEKRVELAEGGRCSLVLPARDRYRAIADDVQALAAYADTAAAIDGVEQSLTVQEIIEHLYQQKAGLPAAAMNVAVTIDYVPRNYNVFRTSVLAAARELAEHSALAVYQRRSDARIEVQPWPWGTGTAGYRLSTAEEVRFVEWRESAFDATSAEQLAIENTNMDGGGFTNIWPPHRQPFYGRVLHSTAVATQDGNAGRHLTRARWWQENRGLGSLTVTAPAQLWVEHDLELEVLDHRFLGFGEGETWIVDGWEHLWDGGGVVTRMHLVNTRPERFLARSLRR